jgi:hypothetical protein
VNLYQKINLLIYRVAELSDNGLAGVIIDRFGKDVMIVPADEEHFEVNVRVAVSRQFLGWVIALGEGVRITEPDAGWWLTFGLSSWFAAHSVPCSQEAYDIRGLGKNTTSIIAGYYQAEGNYDMQQLTKTKKPKQKRRKTQNKSAEKRKIKVPKNTK